MANELSAFAKVRANIKEREVQRRTFTFEEYLNFCKENPQGYANVHERLLKAIGSPTIIDTRTDSRLNRIHMGHKIKVYKAFEDFYGADMVETVERLVGFLTAASQGLEEARQILYLLGPVGSAKSSLAERLKELGEKEPIYVLAYDTEDGLVPSPIYESPLGLIPREDAAAMEHDYGIPQRYFKGIPSPWAIKRLRQDLDGDINQFKVMELMPSRLKQIGIAKAEPGDDNNQDISTLVGKVDIRKLEDYSSKDPDAYDYSGALCFGSQGIMEFVEMFKAPLKTLHPLLTATQEGNFNGTEAIGAIPFQGLILAHSNEQEWDSFQKNKKNEAFLDRVRKIPVRYNLRLTDEQEIYKKMLRNSALAEKPIAPYALEFLARVTVASRLEAPTSSSLISKVRVYDGQNLKDEDPKAKTHHDYIEDASLDEGFQGLSPRFAFKVLSEAFNMGDEVALDAVELAQVLKREIRDLRYDEDSETATLEFIDDTLTWFHENLEADIRKASVENHQEYAQNRFERYFEMADKWCDDVDYKDPITGTVLDRAKIDAKLSEIEKPAGISNPKDFRHEVVKWVLRNREGKELPRWDAFEKIRKVIEHYITKSTEDLTPILTFEAKRNSEDEKKFNIFMDNMRKHSYTDIQIRRLVDWHMQRKVSK